MIQDIATVVQDIAWGIQDTALGVQDIAIQVFKILRYALQDNARIEARY